MEAELTTVTGTKASGVRTTTKTAGAKQRSGVRGIATQAALMGAMAGAIGMGRESPSRVPNEIEANHVERVTHPWDTIQLTKAQRKGKSPEELQALRKSIWAGPLTE